MPEAHDADDYLTPCLRPRPGPLYWDWRCLNCDAAIAAHPSWWRRMFRRTEGSDA